MPPSQPSEFGAILLEHEDFDVIVFLADEEGDCAAVVAPGRPMFRKGTDSRALTTVLREIVRQVRREPAPF